MRSARATVLLVVFLSLLAAIIYLAYRGGLMMLTQAGFFGGGGITAASIGRMMFEWVMFFVLSLIMFIAPGVAAGSIVGERERRTLHVLQLTMLRPLSIAIGKLGASLAFLLLLVMAALPLFTVPLVLGGVSIWHVLKGALVVTAVALFLTALGTFISAASRRVQAAVVIAYLLAFAFFIGTPVVMVFEVAARSELGNRPPERPLTIYITPLVAMADAVTDSGSQVFGFVPFTPLRSMIDEAQNSAPAVEVGPDGALVERGPASSIPVWPIFVGILFLLSIALVALAAVRLRLPASRLLIARGGET